jgi:hypothetical protein
MKMQRLAFAVAITVSLFASSMNTVHCSRDHLQVKTKRVFAPPAEGTRVAKPPSFQVAGYEDAGRRK